MDSVQRGLTRRELLLRGGGVAATLAAGLWVLSVPAQGQASGKGLDLKAFTAQVGTSFDVEGTPWRLLEANALAPANQQGRRLTGEAFSLVFGDGPDGAAPPHGTFRVRHKALGQCTLFLAPVGMGKSGPRAEAVVNCAI